MEALKPITVRKLARLFALSMIAAIAGTLLARGLSATLKTSPPWLGPAIVVGVLTILIGGLLLLPGLLRAVRIRRHGPLA